MSCLVPDSRKNQHWLKGFLCKVSRFKIVAGYLSKHQSEIINYNRRSRAGKTIGSGQVKKGVDLTVGSRQKNRGMSWSPKGSKALCLLKVAELNGQWQQL